jgi:aminoglycoside 6'-N-acetyltransferase
VTIATLRGERVVLRPTRPEDRERLRRILAEPSVARWWGPRGDVDSADDWLSGGEDTTVYSIELDGELIGSIQVAEESDVRWRPTSSTIAGTTA